MRRWLKIMMVLLMLFSLPKFHEAQDMKTYSDKDPQSEVIEEDEIHSDDLDATNENQENSKDLPSHRQENKEVSDFQELIDGEKELETEDKEELDLEEALETEDKEELDLEEALETEDKEELDLEEKLETEDKEEPDLEESLENEEQEVIEDSQEQSDAKETIEDEAISEESEHEIQNIPQSRQSIRVDSDQALRQALGSYINYPGKLMTTPDIRNYANLLNRNERALLPSIGILSNAPLYVDYADEQFDLRGKINIEAFSLYGKSYSWGATIYTLAQEAAARHNLRDSLSLTVKAYDDKGREITSVTEPSRPLFLRTSISGAADHLGHLAFSKKDVSLRFGIGNQAQITKNPDDMRRFLSAHSMRLSVSGGLNAYKISPMTNQKITLTLAYDSGRQVDRQTIYGANNYEAEYGRDLIDYVQFGRVQEDAEFTRAPISNLRFTDGYYYLDSDIGIRSKRKDWMLVAVNKPGKSLEDEDCDCDWVRYFNLTDLYREKVEVGEDVFDIDWSARLGNETPITNHAFELQYHLIDPQNLSQEAIDNFLWNDRNTQEAFDEVFKPDSIQKTSLTSVHYFDLSLIIESSYLYRENQIIDDEVQWDVEEYIESEFLVDADERIMDENGQMKDYNLQVSLFSQNPYNREEIQEEACILLDGAEIDIDLEEKNVDGTKRYLHRFTLKKKLPSACEGEAKELHFDEDYRYYIRANIQRKVEGEADVYIRSGYHDIALRRQTKIHRRLITAANEYEDKLIYIEDEKQDFNQEKFIAFYQDQMKDKGRDVSYMGYVLNVDYEKDPSSSSMHENAYLDLETMDLNKNKKHYLVFYESYQLMYSDLKNNFLSFHFPFLYRDQDKYYYSDVLTDTKITNPYFVLSNAHKEDKKESMTSIAVSMLPYYDEEGQRQDGFALDLEIEVFGIRNWMFANMERGDIDADRTAFYEIALDQVNEEKKIMIDNEEVLKEHIQVLALIAHDDYFEEGVENPEDPEGCPHHKKTRIHYRNPEALKVDEKYRSKLQWTIQYTELKIKGGQ